MENSKMKIMHISPVSHPCFTDLMNEQRKKHEIIFIKLDLIEEEKPYKTVKNKKDACTNVKNVKKSCDQSYDIELRKIFNLLLKKYKPHLIHIHVFSGVSLLPILNVASSLGIKKVLTLHDHSLFCIKGICYNKDKKCKINSLDECNCQECLKHSSRNNLPLPSYNQLRKQWVETIINQSDMIICPSNYQREQLISLFGKSNKFVALHYGVKLPEPSFVKKNSSKPVFGYLGTLAWMKGISVIEAAVEQLQNQDFEVLMGLTCDLTKYSDREYLKKLSKNKKIKLKKNIPRSNLFKDFFSQIDYLIIPSLWNETGPMTLFESFCYKIPVIISNNQSMVEKIRGNKSSIIFNDAKELAAIIKDIIGGAIKKTKKDKFNFKGINQYSGEIDSIYNKLVLRKERGLFLKLGYKCNNNCIFCVTGDNYPREFIDFNTLKETLTKDRELYSSLVLTGGEPTIRKDFFDILEIAYRLGYKILLQTNARMFSYKNFAELAKDFNLKLMINVNGHNAAIHDATTCVKGSFEQTIEGIRNLQRCGFEILCKVMLTKINYSYLLDTVKYITGLGIKEIWLVFLTPYGSAKLNFDSVVPAYSEVEPIVNQAILWLKKKGDIKIGLEGFPYCCINQDFHSLITEQNFDENSLDGIYPAENEDKYNCKRERILNQKQKTDECRECKFKNKCEGVYKEYINKVGVEEFKAIR